MTSHLMFPLEDHLASLRPSQEAQPLKPDLKPSLQYFTMGACLQARGPGKVKVHKGHIGDSQLGCVGSLYASQLWLPSVDGGVGDN